MESGTGQDSVEWTWVPRYGMPLTYTRRVGLLGSSRKRNVYPLCRDRMMKARHRRRTEIGLDGMVFFFQSYAISHYVSNSYSSFKVKM